MIKIAVCGIITHENKILAVSRKNDHNDFGLPGGKVEEGETLIEALVREVNEETGIELYSADVSFHDVDQDDFLCIAFEVYSIKYDTHTNENIVIKWMTIPEFLSQGSFKEFNRKLFKKVYGISID